MLFTTVAFHLAEQEAVTKEQHSSRLTLPQPNTHAMNIQHSPATCLNLVTQASLPHSLACLIVTA
jgi:hypothetical protein